MNIYHFDKITREYLGESIADKNPLEKGKYLIPLYSTPKKPPAEPKGKKAIFKNDWSLVDNFRGQIVYSTDNQSAKTIKELGKIPDGYTLLKPATPYHTFKNGAWFLSKATKVKNHKNYLSSEINTHLNKVAQLKQYDSSESVRTWAGFVNAYQTEAKRYSDWNAKVWEIWIKKQDSLTNDELLKLTGDDVIKLLPIFEW